MRKTKLLITVLALILLITSLSVDAFAEKITIKDSILDKDGLTYPDVPEKTNANYVNSQSYVQSQILSHNGYQYAAYYNANRYICVARRKLPNGPWEYAELTDYKFESYDSHNVVSIGISPNDGTLHMAFDMHSSELRYRRSVEGLISNPEDFEWNASLFGPIMTKLEDESGERFNFVTYPRFITTPKGDMLMYFRDRFSGSGRSILYKYSMGKWTRLGIFITSLGVYEGKKTAISDERNAYHSRFEFDSTGRLHTTFMWRDGLGTSFPGNHDLNYIYSDDEGLTWKNSDGAVVGITGAGEANSLIPESMGYVVNGDKADRNYYSDGTLRVSNKGVNTGGLTYIRFDLTKSNVSNINKVILRLGVHYKEPGEEGKDNSVTHEVYGITNDWNAETMTWKSGSPNHNPDPNTYEITGVGSTAFLLDTKTFEALRWIDYDVTDYVKTKIAEGEDKVSFMIANNGGSGLITLYSKRFDPQLVLNGDGTMDWQDLVNVESPGIIVGEIPQGDLMENDMCIDPEGVVHSVVNRGIWNGKFTHYWRDTSGKWHQKSLKFGGVGYKIFADDKAIYSIYRDYFTYQLQIAMATKAKNYDDWSVIYQGEDLPLFGSSIQLDLSRFKDERIVTIMAQEQYVTAGDPMPIHVMEWVVPEVDGPTPQPTVKPSPEPTVSPSPEPTIKPTAEPTSQPTAEPTTKPTAEPTSQPTVEPTAEPTIEPTSAPTSQPTSDPSDETPAEPTVSGESTEKPTGGPTDTPKTGDYGILIFALALLLSVVIIKLSTRGLSYKTK